MISEAFSEVIVTDVEEKKMYDAESRSQELTSTEKKNERTNTTSEKTNTVSEKTNLEHTKTTKQKSFSDNKFKTLSKRLSNMLREKFRSNQLLKRILNQSLNTVTMRDFFDASSEFAKLLHRKLNAVKNSEKINLDTNEIKISQVRVDVRPS